MQDSFHRILTGIAFFTCTIVFAVIGYALFGWELIDAFYMTIITVFGVGYGEVRPLKTPGERIFTILVIFAGFVSVAYIVGGFVQMMMEGEINRALDIRRKTQEMENLCNHVIVCGYGRMGQILVRQLATVRATFIVIDNNPERIEHAEAHGYLAHLGSATDEEVLQQAGILKARTLATVLPDDAINVFITLTARGLNPDLIILARGELPSTEKKLRLAGANHVVLPAAISAQRMTNLITRPTAVDFLDQNGERNHLNELLAQIEVQMDELPIPLDSPLVGSTIGELEMQAKSGFIVIAVRRAHTGVVDSFDASTLLHGGDTVIVLGHRGNIPQFARFHDLRRKMRYRGAKK